MGVFVFKWRRCFANPNVAVFVIKRSIHLGDIWYLYKENRTEEKEIYWKKNWGLRTIKLLNPSEGVTTSDKVHFQCLVLEVSSELRAQ